MKKECIDTDLSHQQLMTEMQYTATKRKRWNRVKHVFATVIVTTAICILISYFWFPLYRVNDNTLSPYLEKGQVVIVSRSANIRAGDIVAIFNDNQIDFVSVVALEEGEDQIQIREHKGDENSTLITIDQEKTVGKVIFCIWPLLELGYFD